MSDLKTTEKVEDIKVVDEIKFTPEMEEFLTKRLQSETDKRVTKFLKELETEKSLRVGLEKQIEQEKIEKMSEKEKMEFERKRYEETLKQRDIEISNKELKWTKSQMLFENKMSSKFLDIVTGNDVESFEKNIKNITELIESEVHIRLQNRVSGQKAPETSITKGDKSSLEIQLEQATKSGKTLEAVRIQRLLNEQK